jgi:hypothetical protein
MALVPMGFLLTAMARAQQDEPLIIAFREGWLPSKISRSPDRV